MKISSQYPLVELLAGLAFCACALRWGPTAPAFVNSLFISAVIVLFFTDYWHQILPNVLTLPGIIAGVILSPLQEPAYYSDGATYYLAGILSPSDPGRILSWTGSLLGALVGGGILFIIGWTYQIARKKQGLGMGDVKMMAFVGAFLGWRLAFLTIFAGSLLGSLAGIFLVFFQGKNLQAKLAFGTFLGVGAVAALFFGLRLFELYITGL
jgi:leader peptidase (prepilin peptidase)/N-methyltransferase